MSAQRFARQSHRWLSIVFTLTVVANFVAIGMGQTIIWLYYLPLPPLYLFALPYFGKRRRGSTA
jgi:hypothetical protein